MKPLAITKKQFVAWLIVTAGAFGLWMAGEDGLASLAMGILAFSQFIIMTPVERARPLARRDFFLMTAGLLAFIGFGLAIGRWVPKHYGEAAVRFMRHPIFVIPTWALGAWFVYRRWRLSQTEGQGAA
jgi:hypothetical protein